MALTRVVLMACLLAVRSTGRTAAASEITAFEGANVLLPCPCSSTTEEVVWQTGEVVVNHYNALKNHSNKPHDLYKDRSVLYLPKEKGKCSLLLLQVSESDQRNFTCYTFDEETLNENLVSLTVSRKMTDFTETPSFTPETDEVYGNIKVGFPLTLIGFGIVAIIICVILLRRRRQRIQRREIILDPMAGLPVIEYSPV
ncbi:uncharacterized protein [Salminus brasiliensis]|uniref:uncharacterized protein n=1 Tax=Salminus brasiliensis TaxID=930266 RepID=UPI003B83290D